jgi:CHRD domain
MGNDNRRELTPRELQRQRRKEQIQRRRLVAGLCLLGLIIVIIVLVTTCSGSKNGGTTTTTGETTSTALGAATYTANLTGADAVPPVQTDATGTFLMSYDRETKALTYSLTVTAITSPSTATIYEGAAGEPGAAVYTLFPGPAQQGEFTGVLAKGPIDETNLTGSLEGGTLDDLIALIKDGKAYVSVGTTANPVDAIRGQIAESSSGAETTVSTDESDTTDTSSVDQSDTTTTT